MTSVYRWYVVGVLMFAYTVSYVDRIALTLMVGPIRQDLGISEVQFSLLHGMAFALLYAFLGLPFGWMADRTNRTRLIAAGAFAWSVMTALCGLSRNFWQIFLARVGVGIGEATLSPAAYSVIADYFRSDQLTRAISVYGTGQYIGSGLALIVGGAVIAVMPALDIPMIGHMEPWQVVFLALSAPGILVVALVYSIREPARSGVLQGGAEIAQTFAFMRARWKAYACHFFGFGLLATLVSGTSAWMPAFITRSFAWTAGEVGLWLGMATLIFGAAGISVGAIYSGWLRKRGMTDSNLRIGIVAAAVLLPCGVIAPLMSSAPAVLTLYAVALFFSSFPFGGAAAAMQEITPNQMRGQVSALGFVVVNLAGIGLGPFLVAAITQYAFANDLAVRYSLSINTAITAPLAALILYLGLKPYRACMQQAQAWS